MERYTEYHNGVAVIRDKSLLKEAMHKLAGYEDAEEGSKDYGMEKITTEFAEWICEECCKKLDFTLSKEEADEICAECKMGKFICDICNLYLDLDRFVGSNTEKLMEENAKLKKALEEMSKDCTDCRNYWQNTDTENECNGQKELCHEFAEMEK